LNKSGGAACHCRPSCDDGVIAVPNKKEAPKMPTANTLFGKVWDDHVIVTSPQGEDLLYTDFNYINEGQSFLAFDQLRLEGRTSARPEQHLAVTDHYLPTINRQAGIEGIANPEIRNVVSMMANNAAEFGLPHIHMHHARQGIAHVIGPELGISQPGMLSLAMIPTPQRMARWAPVRFRSAVPISFGMWSRPRRSG
jgi:hypothetical protein